MAQPLRSMNPSTPFGREKNALLQTDLRDPNAFLGQLIARNAAVSAPAAPKPKKAEPQPQAQPATPPATPTSPTPQPPQSRPTPQLATSFDAQRKAARDAYDAELAGFSQRSQQGNQVTPLEQKRALERYNNQLGRINAIENKGIRKKRGEQLRSERLARENYADERAGAILDESTKRLTSLFDSTPKPPAVNIPGPADRAAMAEQMAANDAQRAAADRLPTPATPAPTQPSWLDTAILRTIDLLQAGKARTPTARLSAVAAPAEAPQTSGGGMPEPPQRYGLDPGVNKVISNLYSGNVAPGNLGIDQLGELMRGATPQQLASLYDGLQALPPEQQKAALQKMIEQNQQLNVNLGQPPKVTPEQAAEIDRLNPPASFFSMDGFNNLAQGFTDLTQNPVLQTIAGPGGLLGTSLPADAIARERAMATTPEQLRMIQAREAQAGMQGALLDALGAGVAMRGSAAPNMTAPGTRVIDNPTLRGRTPNVAEPAGPTAFSRFNPNLNTQQQQNLAGLAEWQSRSAPSPFDHGTGLRPNNLGMLPPSPNPGVLRVTPGNPGQVVDMPAPQAMPGVTPRDLPTNTGGPRQGPMRPIGPVQTADESFTAPTVRVKNVPGDINNPTAQRRTEQGGRVPASPTGREQGPGTAAAEGQMRVRRSDARVRELQEQDRVTDIINNLIDRGVLQPNQPATSTPEAKPATAPAPATETALAQVAKPATPAPAAEAPIPLAEPSGTTVGRNTVQTTTVKPRATPAPGQKAQSRKSVTEALKAYGTKVVEDTRALLAKDRKGQVTDSDVLEYLQGLLPTKESK